MINRNWPVVVTSSDRYEFTGILDFAIEHLKQGGIKRPTIIDVGCSFGIAMKKASEIMKISGIDPFTIGIDTSKSVKSKAEKNLDQFIDRDVLEVYNQEGIADIVICSKAALYILGTQRADIIRKCASFLKDDGILITDVDCYPPRTVGENTTRFLKLCLSTIPTVGCFKHGIKNFNREYGRSSNVIIREDVFKKTKNEAMSYADEIIQGWEARSPKWKHWWEFRILISGLAFSR